MKQLADSLPTANIAVNKSRLKMYNKNSDTPTFYLQKGQEFQIELFNPTTDTILAKISLNNKAISQGGLVLRPGQRVFLDRYLDVANKFKFDTYEVADTKEVQKAIENNGDFKVDFYREREIRPILTLGNPIRRTPWNQNNFGNDYFNTGIYGTGQSIGGSFTTTSLNTSSGEVTFDSLDLKQAPTRSRGFLKSKKTIETGRVEEGSYSDQKFKTVSIDFEYIPFHTLEYKLLPVSQKVNTTSDINVARYCTECGIKQKPTNKFCPKCGTKV